MLSSEKMHNKMIACIILTFIFSGKIANAVETTEFNTDILDIEDKRKFDVAAFSQAGYIMPGIYPMSIVLNKNKITDTSIEYFNPPQNIKTSIPCLTTKVIELFAIKDSYKSKIGWYAENKNHNICAIIQAEDGWQIKPNMADGTLSISIPQAWLEYISANWDPPARWNDGITGALFDYNMNFNATRAHKSSQQTSLSGNGIAGFNIGAWRARADWQTRFDNSSSDRGQDSRFQWNRYYLYRPIPSIKSRLSLGENFLNSDLFDSFRFTGLTLRSDDSMLPPNLRGYAPEITGIAKTNAKVTISQQGSVIYQTQVAPGPFNIQDLNDAVNGQLDVEVKEEDGTVQKFTVQTSDIPYLTRPGSIRYKISAGRPTDIHHHSQGDIFSMGEFSWGIANGWSLYGGATANNNYQAIASGIGRDLMVLGALSFDVTHARAKLPETETKQGNSYRLSYSKRFDEYNSQVTFAGYRFSERDYISMADFLDASQFKNRSENTKEMYTIRFNQQLSKIGANIFFDYNHRTYWSNSDDDRYSISLAKYLDFGNIKNINFSVNAYRNKINNTNDDGVYLSVAIPWGNRGSLSLNSSRYSGGSSNQISYFSSLDDSQTYQIAAGKNRSQNAFNGFYSYMGDDVKINANASYQAQSYTSAGLGIQGGITATTEGAALHRVNMLGATRVLVDTNSVSNVPVRGFGTISHSNMFGKTVVSDVNNYYRNQLSIDVNKMQDDVDAINTIEQITLTEGAIGYRHFDMVQGEKGLIYIKMHDGSSPPFGATVKNSDNKDVGIVNDDGSVYISGIKPSENMFVYWDGGKKCTITFPNNLNLKSIKSLLLPCSQ